MKEKITDLPDISHVYRMFSKMDYWQLEDAARLVMGLYPRSNTKNLSEIDQVQIQNLMEIAVGCFGETLTQGRSDPLDGTPSVKPRHFIGWIHDKDLNCKIPPTLISALETEDDREFSKFNDDPNEIEKSISKPTRRVLEARTSAKMIWHENPKATFQQVYDNVLFKKIGCRGQPPSEKTAQRWLRGLNPSIGGRPNLRIS